MKIREQFVPFSPPTLGPEEIAEVSDTLSKDWLSTGPKTKLFEEKFCGYVGAESALALNSCTAGLHIALMALGVGPGDEVITTAMTFCATANVVEHVGAKVVLVDIEPDTLLIDPREIEKKITKKTKVIIPVHYAGQPCDMAAINALAECHGIHVIEDAAHCMPSKIGNQFIGSSKNLTAFSFYATKNMTTGEGGMLTGPKDLIQKAKVLSLHGMSHDAWKRFEKSGSWKYDVGIPGYKYNMSDIQSSLGLVQLKKLSDLYGKRVRIVEQYNRGFKDLAQITRPVVKPGVQSSHHLYVVQVNNELLKIDRDQFIEELKTRNVGTSVHYIPIHMHSYYQNKYGWTEKDFPRASSAFKKIISLPLSPRHSEEDINYVIEAVKDIVQIFKR